MADLSPPLAPDLAVAIRFALLVKMAEAVPPDQTVYNPGDTISVSYGAASVDYTVVATIYGNDLATDVNPLRADQIVSFGFVAQDPQGNGVVAISSSLKFDFFWADLVSRIPFDRVERATSDLLLRGGVRTPRNSSVFTTALRFSTNC